MSGALVFGGESVAYAELQARALRAAQGFASLGAGARDVVALMLPNAPAYVEAMLAARHLGAFWCPINWHFKQEEARHLLADSGAKCLVATPELAAQAGVPEGLPLITDWPAWRDSHAPHAGPPAARPGQMMAYTSGTTGRPKGVLRAPAADPVEQMRLGSEAWRVVYALAPGTRALLPAPLYHSAPNAYAMQAVLNDATLYLEPRFDALRTLELIERERLTHLYLVPTMMARLLKLPAEVRARYDCRSVEFAIAIGSPCSPAVKRAMIDWWGPVINESYAASELGLVSFASAADALAKPGTAGRPVGGARISVRDAEGRELPAGRIGLIYARQPATPDFTYNHNDAARQALERDGQWSLGDMGYLDEDGYLFVCDRAVDMVVSGGVNIYPAEIEGVLVGMPGVADCAVFGVPDEDFGESLAAAVQPQPGSQVSVEEVRDWLRERIADYKVPRLVTFHEALPREDSGKIFKRKLRAPYWEKAGRRI